MERRCASVIEGAKDARSPARRTLSRAISLLGGRVSCVVIDSAAEKVLSGGGGICCGLDDPIVPLDWAEKLAGTFKHGWFATVPGPHATMFASPKLIADLIDEHAHR